MFFGFAMPPHQPVGASPEAPKNPADFNQDGSPKWLRDQTGALILNDYSLITLVKEEAGFPEPNELSKSMTLRTGAWTPIVD